MQSKLSRDIAWTVGSFVILAASGMVINLVVAGLRDAAALGVFNQSYAVYIVASQLAIFGIHYSVLRHAAYFESDGTTRARMLGTALATAAVLGVVSAGLLYLVSPLFAKFFESETTGRAIGYAAAGLLVFPLNKVLVAYLNGLRRMRAFAVLQAMRYLAVMTVVIAVSASSRPFEEATFAFFVAELLTVVMACGYMAREGLLRGIRPSRDWLNRHLAFGWKSLLSGLFVEMNARIDVLLIGAFLSDQQVGIYSFAAMLVDGLYHLLAMVRVNFNPVLVGAVRDKDWTQAQTLLARSKKFGAAVTIGLSVLVVGGFLFITTILVPEKGMQAGIYSLLILLTGLSIIAAFVPFDNLLLVSGHPGYQTFQQLIVVTTNVGLGIALIPMMGIEGAALATATSYVVGISCLVVLVRKFLTWNLLTNAVGR